MDIQLRHTSTHPATGECWMIFSVVDGEHFYYTVLGTKRGRPTYLKQFFDKEEAAADFNRCVGSEVYVA